MQKSLRGATPFLTYTFRVNFRSSLDTSLLAKSKQTNSNNNKENPASLQILQKASANNKGRSVYKVDSTDSHRLHTTDSKGQGALIPENRKLLVVFRTLAAEMKRLREITRKFDKEKIGMKRMSETASPPLPASHFQGTSPTGNRSRFSHVQLLATPWTVAHQAPLSMGFSRTLEWVSMPSSR